MVYVFLLHFTVFTVVQLAANGFGLFVGGLLKPYTVCQYQRLLIAQKFIFALSAH